MATFRITTLGCKVNQCESAGMARKLCDNGWQKAGTGEPADLVVVNTCTVTGKAAMQSRQALRQAVRGNPGATVVATGCYAQIDPEILAAIDGVAAVLGTGEKMSLVEDPGRPLLLGPKIRRGDVSNLRRFAPLPTWGEFGRTRPFLKIQDGCSAHCTYCIVPSARGPSRSLPPQQVLAQLRELAGDGFLETVLTGIHMGCYGLDLSPATSLDALLAQMDADGAMARIRLSSIEPREISEAIVDRVAGTDRFCRHFHVPLQSGDDTVLRRMGRPYTREFFADLIRSIPCRIPRCAIGVDVLAGFPGESDAAFENTLHLLEDLPITYLHVFPFSAREGTPASRMPDPVPPQTAKARCRRLRQLGDEKKKAFYAQFVGRRVRVLAEGAAHTPKGLLRGFSDHYLPVLFPGDENLRETFVTVRIDRLSADGQLFGVQA